jgi:hypothetical protein
MWSSWSSELREHFEFGRNRSSACAPTGIVALQTMLAHPFTEKGNQARCLWISWRWKLRLQPALRRGVASLNGRHIYGEAFITGQSSEYEARGEQRKAVFFFRSRLTDFAGG